MQKQSLEGAEIPLSTAVVRCGLDGIGQGGDPLPADAVACIAESNSHNISVAHLDMSNSRAGRVTEIQWLRRQVAWKWICRA
eukprot:scaffold47425_cov41-Prasinocladus_malaysianus.AAC.1